MLVIRAGIHNILVRIANLIRLLLQKQSDLGLLYLSRPFYRKLVFEIFEHIQYINKQVSVTRKCHNYRPTPGTVRNSYLYTDLDLSVCLGLLMGN